MDSDSQKRFFLALVLSGVILLVWQILFPAPEPPVDAGTAVEEQTLGRGEGADDIVPAGTARTGGDAGAAPAAAAVGADVVVAQEDVAQRRDTIGTPWFAVTLDNYGGRVVELTILEPERYRAAADLMEAIPKTSKHYPLELSFLDGNLELPRTVRYEVVEEESKKVGKLWEKITYRYRDPAGAFVLEKIFTVGQHPYTLNMEVVLTNRLSQGKLVDRLGLELTGYKDPNKEKSFFDMRPDELEAICRTTEDVERQTIDSLDEHELFGVAGANDVLWAAVGTRYFMWAAVPKDPAERCLTSKLDSDYARTQLQYEKFALEPGERRRWEHTVYTGPKEVERLEAVGSNLDSAVDFGFWAFLARPLRVLLVFFHGFVHNWGLAIILMTLLLKLLTWPITARSYVNAEKMKKVQPLLQELREKYEHDQQRMSEETLKIFKEHKVSPFGCMPMLIQIPILYAFWVMIYNSVELYQADFTLWYTDLSAPDPYFVLPILMGAAMVAQQWLMPMDTGNAQAQQMRTMMRIMPIVFTAFMLFLPSGLVLYYFVSLILGLLQQWLIKRRFRTDDNKENIEEAELA